MPVFWKKQTLADGALLALLLCGGAGLLFFSRPVAAAMAGGVEVCLRVLLPALFPFFVLSDLLVTSGVIQRIVGARHSCAAAVVLGMVGGYPVGAKTAARLYRQGACTREEALHTLRFCNNCGPAFLISAVGGGLLENPSLGVLLYGIHIISALLLGLLFKDIIGAVKVSAITPVLEKRPSLATGFLQAVTDGFASFLNVCAFVLLFAVVLCLAEQLPLLGQLPQALQGVLFGLLEFTAGTTRLAKAGLSFQVMMAALSFVCGWGGCSVQLQTVNILRQAGLPCRGYLQAKALHGLLAGGIALLLC